MFIKYIYSFVVWPAKNRTCTKSFIKIFQYLDKRIELVLTEEEFDHFRHELLLDGLALHEIERKLETPSETIQ